MDELVLTGYRDFWPKDEGRALFLGPWCFSHNHKYSFWEQDKFRFALSPWQDPGKILEASLYIDSLCDRIIPKLADILNKLHNVEYSQIYWRTYIMLWLVHFLGILYDRYKRLESLGCLQNRFYVKILKNYKTKISNFWDFSKMVTESHYYNLSLMSEIIDSAQFDFLRYEGIDCSSGIYADEVLVKGSGRPENKVIDFFRFSAKSILDYIDDLNLGSSSVHLGCIYGMSPLDKFRIQFTSKPGIFLVRIGNNGKKVIRGSREELIKYRLEFAANNKFEKIVEGILLRCFPDSLLTIYPVGKGITSKIKVWIGNDIYISARKASQIADILENGGRWISVQHGGGYGQLLSLPSGKVEYSTGGEFITWGWKCDNVYAARYYALPSPMLSKLKKHKEINENLIFVGTASSTYMYRLATFLTPEQLIVYLNNKLRFLESLAPAIIKKVRYRPYLKDLGMNEFELLNGILTSKQFLIKGKLTTEFSRAHLAVIDNFNTSFLEALVINVPTILFSSPGLYVFSEQVAPFFDRLRGCGILYDDPCSAAKKVNQVWADPKSWWEGMQVQAVRKEFCCQFARSSSHWRKEWLSFLKSMRCK